MYRFKSFPKDISVKNAWLQSTYWWIWLWGNIRYKRALDSKTRTTLSGSYIFSMLRGASVYTSVILAGKRDSRRHSTTRFSENVADKWRSFIILRSGEDLTSFNKDNCSDVSSKKRWNEAFRECLFFLRICENTSNVILVVVLIFESKRL